VLLRALEDRGVLESVNGRIAVGWLVVEDMAMVFTLVLLPPLAGWLDGGARGPFMQVANENILQFLARPEVPEAELTTKRALVAALRERVIPAWSGGAAGPAVLRGPACMSGPFQSQPA
jgi:CPA2 family monovalent cation:H+ antiporter-2